MRSNSAFAAVGMDEGHDAVCAADPRSGNNIGSGFLSARECFSVRC